MKRWQIKHDRKNNQYHNNDNDNKNKDDIYNNDNDNDNDKSNIIGKRAIRKNEKVSKREKERNIAIAE